MNKVKQSVDHSKERLYENPPINSDDPHAIKFNKLDEEKFLQIKKDMINQSENSKD